MACRNKKTRAPAQAFGQELRRQHPAFRRVQDPVWLSRARVSTGSATFCVLLPQPRVARGRLQLLKLWHGITRELGRPYFSVRSPYSAPISG